MSRRKQSNRSARKNKQQVAAIRRKNNTLFLELLNWFVPESELFSKNEFHGNTKWNAEQLAVQALIWSWQETKHVTDAFDHTQEVCDALGMKETAKSYTSMMNALDRYHDVFTAGLRERFQALAEKSGGRQWETDGWVLGTYRCDTLEEVIEELVLAGR